MNGNSLLHVRPAFTVKSVIDIAKQYRTSGFFALFISYPQKILWAALETTQRMLYNVQYCIGRGERGGFFFLEEVNTCLREEIYDPLGAKHKETV